MVQVTVVLDGAPYSMERGTCECLLFCIGTPYPVVAVQMTIVLDGAPYPMGRGTCGGPGDYCFGWGPIPHGKGHLWGSK